VARIAEGEQLRLRDRGTRDYGMRVGRAHVLLELRLVSGGAGIALAPFGSDFRGFCRAKRATEPFRRVWSLTLGWHQPSRLGKREGIGSATVERWFHDSQTARSERQRPAVPAVSA